jgi:hypothetical protein
MQIGIDSFAAAFDETSLAVSASDRVRNLVEQIGAKDSKANPHYTSELCYEHHAIQQ